MIFPLYKRVMFLFDGIFQNLKLCILYKIESHISIVNINHVYALVWDFCPGLKYFVLTDTFTRPALKEGPYYDLEWAVLCPQT